MLRIRNNSLLQLGDGFTNHRLVRSMVVKAADFYSGPSDFASSTCIRAGVNVEGVEAPLVIVKNLTSNTQGAVVFGYERGWGRLFGLNKNAISDIEVYVFGKTTAPAPTPGPALVFRDASGAVNYDSRHIPLVVESFVEVPANAMPVGTTEVDLGVFIPGNGLGVCIVSPRSRFQRLTGSSGYVEMETFRTTPENRLYLKALQIWERRQDSFYQANTTMANATSFILMVDTNKLPIPFGS